MQDNQSNDASAIEDPSVTRESVQDNPADRTPDAVVPAMGKSSAESNRPPAARFGISPLDVALSGIAPLGHTLAQPLGVAPLGALPAMPPPPATLSEVPAEALAPTDDATNETLSGESSPNAPPASAEPIVDRSPMVQPGTVMKAEPPPDSGWSTSPPPRVVDADVVEAPVTTAESTASDAPATEVDGAADAAVALHPSDDAADLARSAALQEARALPDAQPAPTEMAVSEAPDQQMAQEAQSATEENTDAPAPEAPAAQAPMAVSEAPDQPMVQEAQSATEDNTDAPAPEAPAAQAPMAVSEAPDQPMVQEAQSATEENTDAPAPEAPGVTEVQPVAVAPTEAESPVRAERKSVPDEPENAGDAFSGATDPELPRRPMRSRPPPKPAGYSSERPQPAVAPLEVAAVPGPAVASQRPSFAPSDSSALLQRLRSSKWLGWLWGATVVVAGILGWSMAPSGERKLNEAVASAAIAVQAAREAAIAETKASIPPPPAHLDLSQPAEVKSILEVMKTEPGKRTRLEAVALGRQWQQKHFDEFAKLSNELRQQPQKLDESKLRAQVLELVQDRTTSRIVVEMLAELNSPRALDLLYEIWIGSKDRNETTQLAEALLLSKDVRPRVSGALDLALRLRDKPTDCGEIQRLVERAIREGDRRSANQLVTTAARQNCGAAGNEDCVKCLSDVKDMRKAIRAAAARPDPVP